MAEKSAIQQSWLVLLPRLPSTISMNTLKAAYRPGLTQALKSASGKSYGSFTVVMDIAIASEEHVLSNYSTIQSLLGLMYRMICVICTENQIDIEYGNDVDVRLIPFGQTTSLARTTAESHNCMMGLEKLAKSARIWQRILYLEGKTAETLLRDFTKFRDGPLRRPLHESEVEQVPGGLVMHEDPPHNAPVEVGGFHRHRSVAVGGTFDHLHAGHKLLLTMTALALVLDAAEGCCITVGITGDELLKKKQYQEELEDFYQRQSGVHCFLLGILELMSPAHVSQSMEKVTSSEPFGREVHDTLKSGLVIRYVEIFDPCGPTITDEAISALVLSAETRSGGQVVNDKRTAKGWPALEVFEVHVLDAGNASSQSDNNFQGKISSTDIRRRLRQKAAPTKETSSGDNNP